MLNNMRAVILSLSPQSRVVLRCSLRYMIRSRCGVLPSQLPKGEAIMRLMPFRTPKSSLEYVCFAWQSMSAAASASCRVSQPGGPSCWGW